MRAPAHLLRPPRQPRMCMSLRLIALLTGSCVCSQVQALHAHGRRPIGQGDVPGVRRAVPRGARDVEKEIHVHGYDIHFMVYPSQDNILKIELTIAGEFEIENHASGYEFARLIVSP